MKKKIKKTINSSDLIVVYRFFKSQADIFTKIPITADKLSTLLNYDKDDIRKIIDTINKQKRFKYLILGSNARKGYFFINETNIVLGHMILSEREDKCCCELDNIQSLKDKADCLL